MIGETKGNWTVIERVGSNKTRAVLWKCQCKCGNKSIKSTSYLNANRCEGCRLCHQGKREKEESYLKEQLVGKQVGTWTVIKYSGKTKYKSRQWLCRCECGNEKLFLTSYLTGTGKRKATICKACEIRNMELNNRTTEEIPNRFWKKLEHTATRRQIPLEITKEQALTKFQMQEGKCALSGVQLYFTKLRTNYSRYTNASLDRIDSDQPYKIGNIQWVDKRINMMKNKHPQDEFIQLCKLIAENN